MKLWGLCTAGKQARQSLDRVMNSLRAVDTAPMLAATRSAPTRFQARSSWNNISPVISAREAREAPFQSLGGQLKRGDPATQIRSTASGMLEELREDHDLNLNARGRC